METKEEVAIIIRLALEGLHPFESHYDMARSCCSPCAACIACEALGRIKGVMGIEGSVKEVLRNGWQAPH